MTLNFVTFNADFVKKLLGKKFKLFPIRKKILFMHHGFYALQASDQSFIIYRSLGDLPLDFFDGFLFFWLSCSIKGMHRLSSILFCILLLGDRMNFSSLGFVLLIELSLFICFQMDVLSSSLDMLISFMSKGFFFTEKFFQNNFSAGY